MSDADALWAAILAAPADDLPKLVLADYLDERGQERDAAALRWCVARQRWPRITRRQAMFIWYADPSMDHPGRPDEVARAMLPLTFLLVGQQCERCADFERLVGGGGVAYRTLPDAVGYLGYVLAELRSLTGMPPSARPRRCSRRRGHVGFLGFVAHSAPAAAELS